MGLIDFVKAAGEKLFGADEQEQPAAGGAARAVDSGLIERRMAAVLAKSVENLGFAVTDLSIRVDGDVATVNGIAATQEDKEKIVLVVGNTAGIAQVNDELEVAQPTAVFYTVVSGDSLSKIAKEQYGDAMKYPVIFEANKPMLSHPDKIYPGQVLRIPPLEG